MSYLDDEVILTTRFKTEFEALYPNIPVDWVGTKNNPTTGKLVRFRITRAQSKNAAVGATMARTYGSVLVQIRLPTGNGNGEMIAIAKAVSGIFKNWRSGKLKCRHPSFPGAREDGSFIHGTVDIPYQFDV